MTAYIKPTGWASESRYASGDYAGHPTKLKPSAATQLYGIQPQVRPAATELNYVMHSADALLAAFELHGITNFRPAFTETDQIVGIHRPPLGGTIVVTDSASSSVHWYTPGAVSPQSLTHVDDVTSVCSLTNAVYGGETMELFAIASGPTTNYLRVWGTSKIWPHADDGFGDISGSLGQSLGETTASLRVCWSEYHQQIQVFTGTRAGSIKLADFSGSTWTPELTGLDMGTPQPVAAPHGTTLVFGTQRSIKSTDGINWSEKARLGVDVISPFGPGSISLATTLVSHWWSELQDRWYLVTTTLWSGSGGTLVSDLWESTDDGETWSHMLDFGGVVGDENLFIPRTLGAQIRQFRILPSKTAVMSSLLILDETDLTLRSLAASTTIPTTSFLGAAGGSLIWQLDDDVFTSVGSAVPVALKKL